MTAPIKNRGPAGQGGIVFRQNLEYPREPGRITYYPPEPSDEIRMQVRKEKAGGIIVYIIGFAILIIGYIGAMNFSDSIEVYATLIPTLMLLGVVFAVMFLYFNNVTLANLSRAMPLILMICLVLMYIMSIIDAITDLGNLGDEPSEAEIEDVMENLFSMVLNPAFFLMSAGLLITRAGGTMLWISTKIGSDYIPGMIIIETPSQSQQPAPAQQATNFTPRLCANCGKPLEYIPEYQRHYCYGCGEYAPKEG